MITLKTLPQATAQEVFDQVAEHLLKQGERSGIAKNCWYRWDNYKCAAGCLIGDDEYDESMEGKYWANLILAKIAPPEHSDLIISLQNVHDNHSPLEWRDKLRVVANEFKLTFKELTNG